MSKPTKDKVKTKANDKVQAKANDKAKAEAKLGKVREAKDDRWGLEVRAIAASVAAEGCSW